eukprot:3397810-Pleurochrysis_carterae.AAC.3
MGTKAKAGRQKRISEESERNGKTVRRQQERTGLREPIKERGKEKGARESRSKAGGAQQRVPKRERGMQGPRAG